MFVTLIENDVSMRVFMTKFLIKSSLYVFFSMLFPPQVNFITVIVVIIINSFIIAIINAFVIRNFTLSSLLPLSLVFLLFLLLLILLCLFVVVSCFQCCYSYQVTITIIVSLAIVSFLNLHFCFSL